MACEGCAELSTMRWAHSWEQNKTGGKALVGRARQIASPG